MPTYTYVDGNGHERTVIHRMSENPQVICDTCKAVMHRKPQRVAVNWNGLPPHLASARSPAVNALINRELPEQRNNHE